jgi:hypothetical protein
VWKSFFAFSSLFGTFKIIAWPKQNLMIYGNLENSENLKICSGNITNLLWWNETNQCLQSDLKAEAMGELKSSVKGKSSDTNFMISYCIASNGVFIYEKNMLNGQSFLTNITGNLNYFIFGYPIIQFDQIDKIFIYSYSLNKVVWMSLINPGVWYL